MSLLRLQYHLETLKSSAQSIGSLLLKAASPRSPTFTTPKLGGISRATTAPANLRTGAMGEGNSVPLESPDTLEKAAELAHELAHNLANEARNLDQEQSCASAKQLALMALSKAEGRNAPPEELEELEMQAMEAAKALEAAHEKSKADAARYTRVKAVEDLYESARIARMLESQKAAAEARSVRGDAELIAQNGEAGSAVMEKLAALLSDLHELQMSGDEVSLADQKNREKEYEEKAVKLSEMLWGGATAVAKQHRLHLQISASCQHELAANLHDQGGKEDEAKEAEKLAVQLDSEAFW